jgi:RES domain-containing protein
VAAYLIYRLLPRATVQCAFATGDGHGSAYRYGARFNPPFTQMIYGSDSFPGCAWEFSRHNPDVTIYDILRVCGYVRVALEDHEIVRLEDFLGFALPPRWNDLLPNGGYNPVIQNYGKHWADSCVSLAASWPCSFNPRHVENYLINPLHPSYAGLEKRREGPFVWDPAVSNWVPLKTAP